MELLDVSESLSFLPDEELLYQVDLPPLAIADALSNGYSSAGGSEPPDSPQEDLVTKSIAFPPPCEFRISTWYIKSSGPRCDFDIIATFNCNNGELISFTDTLSLAADIPIEVLQSGFTWTDLHQKEFHCSPSSAELITTTHSRMKVLTEYLQSPGAKHAVFHEFFAFVTPKGILKKLELYVIGIERRMEWRAREVAQFSAAEPPAGHVLPRQDPPTQKPKRIRKPRPPRRKKKVWEDKMNKFTVDPSVSPSLDVLFAPLPVT